MESLEAEQRGKSPPSGLSEIELQVLATSMESRIWDRIPDLPITVTAVTNGTVTTVTDLPLDEERPA